MNEYWLSEDQASFCFCHDGDWFQVEQDPSGQWNFCSVTMDRGLPSDMHVRYYNECDLAAMLGRLGWSESELQTQVAGQLHPAD